MGNDREKGFGCAEGDAKIRDGRRKVRSSVAMPPPKFEFAPNSRAIDFKVSLGMRNSAALSSLR